VAADRLNSRKYQNIPASQRNVEIRKSFEVIATASLMAEYLTGSFNEAVILNTEVSIL